MSQIAMEGKYQPEQYRVEKISVLLPGQIVGRGREPINREAAGQIHVHYLSTSRLISCRVCFLRSVKGRKEGEVLHSCLGFWEDIGSQDIPAMDRCILATSAVGPDWSLCVSV